jgi:predicted enzyme related to lactoylglutathione lyase
MSKHAIVHIEIPANVPHEASDFYAKLFGWKIMTDEAMDYVMFEPDDGPGGGFSRIGERVKPGDVLLYIDTDDIAATLAEIEANGGSTVQPKTEIPTIGWFAVFQDPTGNVLGLFTGMVEG